MERSDYEQWLADPVTGRVFNHIKEEREAFKELDSETDDPQSSLIMKGRIRQLADVLDLNNGEAYERIRSTGK